jgi:hypothetical protein
MQFAPALSVLPQVVVSAKSPLCPIEIVVLPVPELVTVTFCPALVVPTACEPNVRLVGDGVTMTVVVPVPVRVTVCGEFDAASVTESVPVRVPPAVGVNVTLTVQLIPAFSVVPQLFVCA